MKKILAVVIALILSLSTVFGLVACGVNDDVDRVDPGNQVENNNDNLTDDNVNEDNAEDGADEFVIKKEDYVKAFNSITTTYNNYLTGSVSVQPKAKAMKVVLGESDFIEANSPTSDNVVAQSTVGGSMALIYFMRNILMREDYVVKDGFDDCVVDENGKFLIRFEMDFDATTSMIQLIICTGSINGEDPEYDDMYLSFDIKYDFTTESLEQFNVDYYWGNLINKNLTGVEVFKFKNGSLSRLLKTSTNYNDYAQGVLNDVTELWTVEKETNPEDYTTEYFSAMEEAWGEDY